MPKRVTIKDIARELNTNSSTVSRALNDSPLISVQMKALVQKKAAEMGYFPNSIARQLREGRSRTIGLLVPLIKRVFFANVIHGAESVAKRHGYQILICQSNDRGEEEAEAIRTLRTQKVAGILVSRAADAVDEQIYRDTVADGTPIVMFDRVSDLPEVNKVVNANRDASYQAVQHLLSQGYRRIVHFGGPQTLKIYQERYAGYCQALEEVGIGVDPDLVFQPVISQEAGRQAMEDMLASGLDFDAVASASDFSGVGALLAMQAAGISIPGEKGLIGFANESFTELIGMSSVEQNSIAMGEAAAGLLLDEIKASQQTDALARQEIVIDLQVIPRATSLRKE